MMILSQWPIEVVKSFQISRFEVKYTYRPLPRSLTIRESELHGLGLFATETIPARTILGTTHYLYHSDKGELDELIRTPLGGFINHSDTPNCILHGSVRVRSLHTLRTIKKGEELTVFYSLEQ